MLHGKTKRIVITLRKLYRLMKKDRRIKEIQRKK
jgi:hypothetical protein